MNQELTASVCQRLLYTVDITGPDFNPDDLWWISARVVRASQYRPESAVYFASYEAPQVLCCMHRILRKRFNRRFCVPNLWHIEHTLFSDPMGTLGDNDPLLPELKQLEDALDLDGLAVQ